VIAARALAAVWRARRAFLPPFIAVALAVLAGAAAAQQAIPPLRQHVTDTASMLSAPERSRIEQQLVDWEAKTGNQMAILIVPTTQPESIEEYSIRVAEAWKIGKKGKDNGVLMLIAKNDKKLRIEVGYGLEGNVPDVIAKRIIAEVITPQFRQGQFASGIEAGIAKIEAYATGADALPPPPPTPTRPASQRSPGMDWGSLIPFLLVGTVVLGGVLRRIFGTFVGGLVGGGIAGAAGFVLTSSLLLAGGVAVVVALLLMVVMAFSGARSGIWIPGGFGGGGFGGGGGSDWSGGGGSFGGGGASGSWE
jgi:uncharacterized protein